jgi:hypothetical protein
MGNFLDTVYDVIFHPRVAMRHIAERRLTGQALFLFFISMMMPPWALRNALDGAGTFPMPMAWAVMGVEFLVCLVFWLFTAAVFSIIAEMFGGRGSALALFAALGFCWLPRVVVMPLWAVAAFLPQALKAVATGVLGIVVAAWILFLSIEAIRASHGLSLEKAIVVMLFPMLTTVGIIITITIFAGAMIASWF